MLWSVLTSGDTRRTERNVDSTPTRPGRVCARDAILFHPVRDIRELETPLVSFAPLYTHHFFGTREEIVGVSKLKIDIFYSIPSIEVYIRMFGIRDDGKKLEEADELRIKAHLNKLPFPGGMQETEEAFRSAFEKAEQCAFVPPAEFDPVLRFPLTTDIMGDEDGVDCVDEICVWELTYEEDECPAKKRLHLVHRRLEWILHFFIDACSNIERDGHWRILLPFIRRSLGTGSLSDLSRIQMGPPPTKKAKVVSEELIAEEHYEVAGLVTTYHFFALPLCRHRISQFFILSHFQARGIAVRLLQWVSDKAISDPQIGELTVEDPAYSFKQLRDLVALRLLLLREICEPADLFPSDIQLPLYIDSDIREQRELHAEAFPCVVSSPLGSESDEDVVVDSRKNNSKISVTEIPPTTLLMDPDIRERIRQGIKESNAQIIRVTEILALAKIIPPEVRCNSTVIQNRGYRQLVEDAPYYNEVLLRENTEQLRLMIKQRLRNENAEEYAAMTPEQMRSELEKVYNQLFQSYLRSLRAIRTSLMTRRRILVI